MAGAAATVTSAGTKAAPVACRAMGVGRVTGCAMEGFAWTAVLPERLLLALASMLPPLLLSMLPPRLPPPPLFVPLLCPAGGAGICSWRRPPPRPPPPPPDGLFENMPGMTSLGCS